MVKLNNMKTVFVISFIAFTFLSCSNSEENFFATGTFEAKEIIVSTGVAGKIMLLDVEEGKSLKYFMRNVDVYLNMINAKAEA